MAIDRFCISTNYLRQLAFNAGLEGCFRNPRSRNYYEEMVRLLNKAFPPAHNVIKNQAVLFEATPASYREDPVFFVRKVLQHEPKLCQFLLESQITFFEVIADCMEVLEESDPSIEITEPWDSVMAKRYVKLIKYYKDKLISLGVF